MALDQDIALRFFVPCLLSVFLPFHPYFVNFVGLPATALWLGTCCRDLIFLSNSPPPSPFDSSAHIPFSLYLSEELLLLCGGQVHEGVCCYQPPLLLIPHRSQWGEKYCLNRFHVSFFFSLGGLKVETWARWQCSQGAEHWFLIAWSC